MITKQIIYYFNKTFSFMLYPYLLISTLGGIIVVYKFFVDLDEESYAVTVVYVLPLVFLIMLILFLRFLIKIIQVFYKKYKNEKDYFLFFVFYTLFFIFYFADIVREISFQYIYLSLCIFFLITLLIYFQEFFKRYIFTFLTLISDIFLRYIISNDFILIFIGYNKQYYNSKLYLIPLTFALIQLSIEAYYFYQKEKPKWLRYERMQRYKESKNQ